MANQVAGSQTKLAADVEALNSKITSQNVTVTLDSTKIASGTIQARRTGNVVSVEVYDLKVASGVSTGDVIGSLPEGVYTQASVQYTFFPLIQYGTATVLSALRIDKNGTLKIINPDASKIVEGYATLIAWND